MKKLNENEFIERMEAVARAKKIFTPHITRNISIAFEIYQEILAENDRKLKLTSEREKDYGVLSSYKRPKCPECKTEMGLRLIDIPKGKANKRGWKSCWVCIKCMHEEYSKNSLQQWLDILEDKEIENGNL